MLFKVGDRAFVARIDRNQKASWLPSMDRCVNEPATIKECKNSADYGIMYKLLMDKAKELGQNQTYWFNEHLLERLDGDVENFDNDRWFVSIISGTIFKLIKLQKGIYHCVDKDGNPVTSEFMRMKEASPECSGFDWVEEEDTGEVDEEEEDDDDE